ncbi:MAG TPA: MTAP family purine nucleoside phosphorylase [Acidimicrobiia bacterium]|nr:MTAP family purine nucleoside phosphorylase [Acidimicrobiia bacterium]
MVGGHSILDSEFAADAERVDVDVGGTPVALLDAGDHVVLQRHGLDRYTAAHAVDHRANLRALAEAGCDRIFALSSVGGLRRELGVGTFLVPDDFIALHLGLSFFDDDPGHRVPGFDPSWRDRVVKVWSQYVELRDGGVYWQTIGPRFETPAEIRLLAAHADVVGMTVASECVLAGELGLPYAAVCIVDNLANGVGPAQLTMDEFEAGKAANRARLLAALEAVLPELAAAP